MDATVFFEGKGFYRVTASPSMRGLADLATAKDRTVTIEPDEGSGLQDINCGPYATLGGYDCHRHAP